MNTLFAKAGITSKDVKITGVRFDFTPFFKREVDVWPVYFNSQGVILKDKLEKEGEQVYFFNPADFGVNFVANSVVTSEKVWKNRPEVVKKFMGALLKGWEAAMDPANEADVLMEVKKQDKESNDELRRLQLIATRGLIKPSTDVKIGTMDVEAWKQTEAIMLNEKQIKKPVRVETILKH
jgi:NitT/TauT family transport system substrate-binding protein